MPAAGGPPIPPSKVPTKKAPQPAIKAPKGMSPVRPELEAAPTLRMRSNTGQNPKSPPPDIYRRFKTQIDQVVDDINEASQGLNVGLNSWWRSLDEIGEELSQHLIACAIDFQGPDQERMAMALKAKGWSIVRVSNDGKPYRHIHAQLEPKGFLSRMGVDPDSLA